MEIKLIIHTVRDPDAALMLHYIHIQLFPSCGQTYEAQELHLHWFVCFVFILIQPKIYIKYISFQPSYHNLFLNVFQGQENAFQVLQ